MGSYSMMSRPRAKKNSKATMRQIARYPSSRGQPAPNGSPYPIIRANRAVIFNSDLFQRNRTFRVSRRLRKPKDEHYDAVWKPRMHLRVLPGLYRRGGGCNRLSPGSHRPGEHRPRAPPRSLASAARVLGPGTMLIREVRPDAASVFPLDAPAQERAFFGYAGRGYPTP